MFVPGTGIKGWRLRGLPGGAGWLVWVILGKDLRVLTEARKKERLLKFGSDRKAGAQILKN